MGIIDVRFTENNLDNILSSKDVAIERAITIIGMKIERYAKGLCPVGTMESTGKQGYRGGTLRNSITNRVEGNSVSVGSNVEYAPYVELGTGPNFVPPPKWEVFNTPKGAGIRHGGYVRPRPYLRPAVEDHVDEFASIVKSELLG